MKEIIYLNYEVMKGVLLKKGEGVIKGSIVLKKEKYLYFQYRSGEKIIQKYLGKKKPEHWIKEDYVN